MPEIKQYTKNKTQGIFFNWPGGKIAVDCGKEKQMVVHKEDRALLLLYPLL